MIKFSLTLPGKLFTNLLHYDQPRNGELPLTPDAQFGVFETAWHNDYFCVLGHVGMESSVLAVDHLGMRQELLFPVVIAGRLRAYWFMEGLSSKAKRIGTSFGSEYGPQFMLRDGQWDFERLSLPNHTTGGHLQGFTRTNHYGCKVVSTAPGLSTWMPKSHLDRLTKAHESIKDSGGFLVYDSETNEIQALDVGEKVIQVELRPSDGMVAAAITKTSIYLFDL